MRSFDFDFNFSKTQFSLVFSYDLEPLTRPTVRPIKLKFNPEYQSSWDDQNTNNEIYYRSFLCTPCKYTGTDDITSWNGEDQSTWDGNHCHVRLEEPCSALQSQLHRRWYNP